MEWPAKAKQYHKNCTKLGGKSAILRGNAISHFSPRVTYFYKCLRGILAAGAFIISITSRRSKSWKQKAFMVCNCTLQF